MPESTIPPNQDFGYCTSYQAGHFYYAKHSSGTFHYIKLKSGISYFAKRKYSIVIQQNVIHQTKSHQTKFTSYQVTPKIRNGYLEAREEKKKEEYTETKSVIKIFGIVVDVSFSLLLPVIQ